MALYICGDHEGIDLGEVLNPAFLAPSEKLRDGLGIGRAGILVSDRCREEFNESPSSLVASCGYQTGKLFEPGASYSLRDMGIIRVVIDADKGNAKSLKFNEGKTDLDRMIDLLHPLSGEEPQALEEALPVHCTDLVDQNGGRF